jgi:CheY-like chemotaxis protein
MQNFRGTHKMDDGITDLDFRPRPTADRPLLGLTVLVVEDSRFASEAMRLLCLRSGARIRRADCIASAQRHLNVYRPAVAIVDLGLPDGSGLDLIARMHAMRPRVPIILGTSGAEREQSQWQSLESGANGFLAKPLESLGVFQAEIMQHLPDDLHTNTLRTVNASDVEPDILAYREDLTHAMDLLALDQPPVGYLKRFLLGVARSAGDGSLEDRAQGLDAGFARSDQADLRAFLSRKIQGLPMAM